MTTTVDTATEIRRFEVEISEEKIEDLRRRIESTRWPTKELVDDSSQGLRLVMLRELTRYWTEEYDFGRESETRSRERTLEITFLEPGAEAYSFTFG